MKVVVLGAAGLLGRHVVEEFADTMEVVALDRERCDVTQADALVEATRGAALLINCAAYTNVDGAETHEEEAYRINALGAENAARAARLHAAALMHISTDFVFDGEAAAPYDEFARPDPRSVYARSKWAGEVAAAAQVERLFVVRVQGLYGVGGGNFASRLRTLVGAGAPLKLDGERRVQPSWARAVARQLQVLATTDFYGTYHVSCQGATTWAAFARRLAARLDVAPRWQEVKTAELAAPAPRPRNCLFHHRRLQMRGLCIMPSWELALDDYLAEEKAKTP